MTPANNARIRGFTLVEVLVALVVLAVGMLGIAGLYVESLRAGRTSIFRTTAVYLAADMADRIRANPQASADYAGIGPGSNAFTCVNGVNICSSAKVLLSPPFIAPMLHLTNIAHRTPDSYQQVNWSLAET